MTELLKTMLRDDYLAAIKTRMMEMRFNNAALARLCGYTPAHIGNVLKGHGSDDAIFAVCKALSIDITTLYKPGILNGERQAS